VTSDVFMRGGHLGRHAFFVKKSESLGRFLARWARFNDGVSHSANGSRMVLELSRIVLEWFSNNPRNIAEWCAKLLELR
jgi:hypothetical protein